jgi:hypothetical protein
LDAVLVVGLADAHTQFAAWSRQLVCERDGNLRWKRYVVD